MNSVELINIGYGNYLARDKVLAILHVGSSPVRRLIKEAREDRKILDATEGKKTRSVLVTDTGFVVLSSILPETLAEKFRVQRIKPEDYPEMYEV